MEPQTDLQGQKSVRIETSRALRLLREKSGNVMPMTAIGMVALAGLVGGGVDVSRAYMIENRLQNACDSGVLAGRRAVSEDGFDSNAQTQANNFFNTNFDEVTEGSSSTSFSASSPDEGNTIEGIASTTVDTAVMQLFGFQQIPLSVTCSASMSVGNSDVMMVLDVTGSMGWSLAGTGGTRIAALKDAMKNFYDTVNAASNGTNARIRYGFVPYSSSVNVGQLLYDRDPNYLADSHTIQSKEAVYEETEVDTFSGWGPPTYTYDTSTSNASNGNWNDYQGSWTKKKDCNDNKPSNTSWTNVGSTSTSSSEYVNGQGQKVTETVTTQPQERTQYGCYKKSKKNWWVRSRVRERDRNEIEYATQDPIYTTTTVTTFDRYVYKPVTYDVSSYKTFASTGAVIGDDGATEFSTWAGCIEERATEPVESFSFSTLLGYLPSTAYDIMIDMAPNAGDDDTKWKPMWPEVAYYRETSSGYLTSATQSDYGEKANAYCPRSARLLSTMTESEFDAYANSLSPAGSTYHSIGMVWGARLASPTGIFESNVTEAPANGGSVARHIIFMTDGEMSTSYSLQTTYGIEWHDRRVTDNGYSDNNSRHSARFLAACEAAKAKGIRVWVIAFASGLTSNLDTCASDDSSFTAANASQLNDAFQEIAKDVGELRVVQ